MKRNALRICRFAALRFSAMVSSWQVSQSQSANMSPTKIGGRHSRTGSPQLRTRHPRRSSRVKLSDYRGKAVLLNFWATWCSPCKVEMPWFVELQKKYGNDGLVILGVAMDDTEAP